MSIVFIKVFLLKEICVFQKEEVAIEDEINLMDVNRTDSLENRILLELRNMHQPVLESSEPPMEVVCEEKGDTEKVCSGGEWQIFFSFKFSSFKSGQV